MNFKKASSILLVMTLLLITSAGSVLRAEDDAATPVTPCPKKAAVTVETVKTGVFIEYMSFSGPGQAEIVAIKSPVSGKLSEIKVSEGSLIDAGQDLAVLNSGMSEEVKKLEAAAAKAKKILTARQNWKEKSESAIQSASRDYQAALDLLNQKKAQADLVVKAPVAGIVHLVMAADSEIAADALLMEITDPLQMLFPISLAAAGKNEMAVGDKFIGTTDVFSGELTAEVIAISEAQVTFRVKNDANQVKQGVLFTFKKLKAEHADAISIPSSAVQKDGLGDFVYVVEKKKAKKLYVTLGASDAGKTMVEKGLDAGASLIASGLECLVDGKKVRIVNEEELAKEKAEAAAKLKEKEAARKEMKAAEPKVTSEAPVVLKKASFKSKINFRLGLLFSRFSINDKNLKAFYGESSKNIPGVEASIHVLSNIDVWASYKALTLEQTTSYFENPVKFKLVPLSVGLRYRFTKMGLFEPFVGTGLNLYSYKESIEGDSALEDTKDTATGFHFQGGTYLHLKHFRHLQGEIFLKYNMVKKTLAEMLPDGTDELDLGGFEMGIGLVIKF